MARHRVALLAAVLPVAAVLVWSGRPSGATGTPQVSVTPSTGLATQVVTVSWQGYQPNQVVDIMQCKDNPQRLVVAPDNPNIQLDCFWVPINAGLGNALKQRPTGPSGSGSGQFEVRDVIDLEQLGCDNTHPCQIYVVPDSQALETNTLPPTVLPVDPAYLSPTFSFAPQPGQCSAAPTNIHLDGASSTATAAAPWSANLCSVGVNLNYIRQDSPQGRQNYLDGLTDVGVTGSPFSSDELAGAPGHRSFAYAPLDVDPVVIVYNMWSHGQQYNKLVLSPRLVAWLLGQVGFGPGGFASASQFFTDPQFVALNPTFNWTNQGSQRSKTDQFLDLEVRAERNTDNVMVTDWLTHDPAAATALAGGDPTAPMSHFFTNDFPTDFLTGNNGAYWPLTGVHTLETEEFEGLVRCGGDQVQGATQCSQGHIQGWSAFPNAGVSPVALVGVMDLASADLYQLPVAQIVNFGGKTVGPAPANIQAALSTMSTNPDGVTQWPNFENPNADAYPLTRVDYAVLPTSGVTPAIGQAIKKFVDFAVTKGQQPGVLPPGYTPLTSTQVTQAEAAAAQVPTTAPPTTPLPPATSPLTGGLVPPAGASPVTSPSTTGATTTAVGTTGPGTLPGNKQAAAFQRPVGPEPSLVSSAIRFLLPVLLLFGLGALLAGPALVRYGRRRAARLSSAKAAAS